MPQIKPTRGICLNRSHPLSRGLVGFWLFNEGSGVRVFDLSGNGNTGTITNALWTPGKFGSALSFDGSGDYVDTADISAIELANVTFSFWGKVNNIAEDHDFITKGQHTSNRPLLIFFDDVVGATADAGAGNTDTISVLTYDGTTQHWIATPSSSIPDTKWHHIAAVVNPTTGKLSIYIDGVLKVSNTKAWNGIQNTATLLRFGAPNPTAAQDLNGAMDNVMIFNRVLSASEIAQLYREPFCMFERAWIPKLIGGQIVELIGTSAALSFLSATTRATRKVGGNVAGTSDVTALLNLIRSLLNIERNWLREALFNGMTANAYKLGTTLSLGWFWVRVAGCSVLYRGSDMDEIDFVNILAVAEQDACEVSPPSYISHNSGSTYFYVVRRFNNCGYQECTLAASVKVSIESNGDLAEPQPNKVFDSGAELIDGNKIRLVWYYCPLEQKSQPMCFNVYYDGRTGQIDYENPLATIEYQGRKFYSYQSSTLEAGKYLFAIRAKDAGGIENSSLARLRIQFDTTSPNAIDILSAEAV